MSTGCGHTARHTSDFIAMNRRSWGTLKCGGRLSALHCRSCARSAIITEHRPRVSGTNCVVFRNPVMTDNPVYTAFQCLNADKDVQDIQDVRCCHSSQVKCAGESRVIGSEKCQDSMRIISSYEVGRDVNVPLPRIESGNPE